MFVAYVAKGNPYLTKEASLPRNKCPPSGLESVEGMVRLSPFFLQRLLFLIPHVNSECHCYSNRACAAFFIFRFRGAHDIGYTSTLQGSEMYASMSDFRAQHPISVARSS